MSPRIARAFALLVCLCFSLPQFGCSDSSAEGSVRAVPPETPRARVRVRTALVEQGRLSGTERVSGTLRAFHNAKVTAETNGRVVKRVVERGEQVVEGDALFELDATRLELELRQAEATLRARYSDLEHARREHARGEELVKRAAISEQHRDDLRHALDAARDGHALAIVARDTARRLLADATIRAPFAGTVDDLHTDVGDFVMAGKVVASVLDFSRARVFGGVTAEDAAHLETGMTAAVSFAGLGGVTQTAELRSVGRAADARDGTYPIELWIEAPDARLREGMVASVGFASTNETQRALAPRVALMRHGGRSEVFVVERAGAAGEGVARVRGVRTGRSSGESVEILEGLRAGDEIVIEGQFALREGLPVAVDGAPRVTSAAN